MFYDKHKKDRDRYLPYYVTAYFFAIHRYREISNIDDRKVQWRAVMDASAGPKHRHLLQSFEGRKKSEGCPGYSLDYCWKEKREIAIAREKKTTRRLDPQDPSVGGIGFGRRARGSLEVDADDAKE